MIKIMDNGLCVDKGYDTIAEARAAMKMFIYDLTTDELPITNQLVDEATDEVYETHCFDLSHHTHEGEI